MFEPTIVNRIEKRIQKQLKPILLPIRRKQLKSTDFTIISNNCWGGVTYEYYGLEKKSPTVGLWFFADDYLRFISNLRYYLSLEIDVKPARESKRYERIKEYRSEDASIGVLDDLEIVMLHYKDPSIAKEKWERRKTRVNFDNLIIKFSYMNDCTYEMLRQFDDMEFKGFTPKKVMFVSQPFPKYNCGVYFPGFEDEDQISNDTYFFNKYFDLTRFINDGVIIQRNNGQ